MMKVLKTEWHVGRIAQKHLAIAQTDRVALPAQPLAHERPQAHRHVRVTNRLVGEDNLPAGCPHANRQVEIFAAADIVSTDLDQCLPAEGAKGARYAADLI